MSSIVRRSASRICAALRTRIGSRRSLRIGVTGESCRRPWCTRIAQVVRSPHGSDGQRQRPHRPTRSTPSISVFDHGFLYGEGVYETLRTYNGQPFLFDRHMRRLRKSAGMLALPSAADRRRDRRALPRDDARGRARRRPGPRGLHPHPGDARRRRADLRSRRLPDAVGRRHRQAARRSAARGVRARRHGRRSSAIVRNHPGIGEPADQVEQPAEQRAGDAGGGPARRASKA